MANGQWSVFNSSNSKIPYDDITSIRGDGNGNIWAGAGAKDNKSALVKLDSASQISSYPCGTIWNITVDEKSGRVWLATNGEGVEIFDGNQFNRYNKQNSILSSNTVSDILIDENGDKWMSTFGGLVFTNIN